MIVLSSYSISWSRNNIIHSSTGDVKPFVEDSVLVPISALKQANAKMIELKYEKEINTSLKQIIANDSIIINEYDNKLNDAKRQIVRNKKQAKVAAGISITLFVSLIISLFK